LKKTILIIGSSGFIGSKIKKKLSKNFRLLNVSKSSGFDISNANSFKKLSKLKIDYIFNLSGQKIYNYNVMKKTIIDGNKNIINFCKNKKIIVYYFSTSLIYGYSNYEKREGSSKKPECKYSKLKYDAEKIYNISGINYKIFRLCNIYDNKKNGIIKNLINSTIKNKIFFTPNVDTYRNYLFVDDFVNLIYKSMYKKLKLDVYNVGFENIKIISIIKSIENKLKFEFKYEDKNINLRKIPSQKIHCRKILKELNFFPKITVTKYVVNQLSK